MISAKNLSVTFDSNPVLSNINIDFQTGNVHGIVGLNGAGKTTFFNTLAQTLKPDNGSIQLHNSKLTFKQINYVETVNFFYSRITANEYLKIFKQTNADFNLPVLQEYFKLPLNELVENYSTGMKKKLALLAALKQDKPVFILDEPFNGLDLETNKILEIIISVLKQKNKTIFVSSHIIEPLITISDKIHLLEKGTFVKTFLKHEFGSIEEHLFGKLQHEARKTISNAL